MNAVTVLPDTLLDTTLPDTLPDSLDAANTPPVSAIRAYLGGSFNPVHDGHIQMAMAVYEQLLPSAHEHKRPLHVALLPNARSPFKPQTIAPSHRLAMLKLAIQNTPLHVSELELWQNPPVYTIDSVRTLRAQYPRDSLIFIMGMDSAGSLDKWKNGLQLTDYVHLWVFNRLDSADEVAYALTEPLPNEPINHRMDMLPAALKPQVTDSLQDILAPNYPLLKSPLLKSTPLKNQPTGRIYIDRRPIAMISSTDIRQQLQADSISRTATMDANKPLKCLHPMVYHYIIAHQLYSAAQFR